MSIALEKGDTYQSLQMVLKDAFGVVIGEGRKNAIIAKLKPVMSEFSLSSLEALVDELQKNDSSDVRNSVLQAVTTHEDAWYQPKQLFSLLDDYLQEDMLESGRDNYRIWVIGCGAGQLPYSLAMNIHQAGKRTKSTTKVTIETTDVSESVVAMAAKGVFEQASMEGITDASKKKYMDERSGLWYVTDDIKSTIRFSTCNLLDDIEDKGNFDLIICLDVLVYFSVPVRGELLSSFARLLDPSGILVAGLNEPVLPFNNNFEMVRHESGIFYRQKAD